MTVIAETISHRPAISSLSGTQLEFKAFLPQTALGNSEPTRNTGKALWNKKIDYGQVCAIGDVISQTSVLQIYHSQRHLHWFSESSFTFHGWPIRIGIVLRFERR